MNRAAQVFFILLLPYFLFAQADTLETTKHLFLKKAILPSSLIVAGSLISGKKIELDIRTKVLERTSGKRQTTMDDYFYFAPIAEMYVADLVGVRAKNHWFDQSKNLLMTMALNQIITSSFKQLLNKTRPNGEHHSMPSGHTSSAFATATVLQEEFKSTSPILAYSGFAFSTTTGTLRVINNKHWLSDVLVGAGIGILSAKIIYHFEPLKNWNPFKNRKNMVIYPSIQHHSYSVQSFFVF